jgi:hypothetical protein
MSKLKVYISYSTPDKEVATKIAIGLEERGHEVLIDADTLTPGQEWRSVLTEALQASDVFISILTEHSISSQYVLTELGTARAFMRTSKKMLVLPVVFGGIPIPPVISDIQAIIADYKAVPVVIEQINKAIIHFLGTRAAQEQKEAEVKARIESNAATFIQEAINSLEKQEARNHRSGDIWYCLGYLTLLIGIAFGFYSIAQFSASTELQWIRFAYLSLKSIVVIGLLIACSKYSFTLGKSYMSEALKSADRIHAISFGKFYLRAYGEKASWSELKEVFQHWNIDRSSAFSNLDTNQFDPKFLEAIIEVAKAASSKVEIKR